MAPEIVFGGRDRIKATMSAYSSLVLAANEGIRTPAPEIVRGILTEVGIADIRPGRDDRFNNLSDHIKALFRDPTAYAENDRFFRPDSVGFSEGVRILSVDGCFEGTGWSLKIHGHGYLWPWDRTDLRERVVLMPALVHLRAAIERRLGGRFLFPPADEALLRSRLVDENGAWLWFLSESM